MRRIVFILIWILAASFLAAFLEGIIYFTFTLFDRELLQNDRLVDLMRMILSSALGLIALSLGLLGRLPGTSRKAIQ